jgi:hypothetical protein
MPDTFHLDRDTPGHALTPDQMLQRIDWHYRQLIFNLERISEDSCWLSCFDSGAKEAVRDGAYLLLAHCRDDIYDVLAPLNQEIARAQAPRDRPCPLAELKQRVKDCYSVVDRAG